MRNTLLLFTLLCCTSMFAQTKKVLLEEFTGAHCGICPNGAYYTDSMLQTHTDLIAVAIHTYGSYDAMVFPAIDTLGTTFAQGAPLGAIDRICGTPPANNTGVYINQWDANITTREQLAPQVGVTILPNWNSSSRLITANVTVNIFANLPAGDYRISLYVVEDSVVGSGSGYDQSNSFDQQVGSPWYGLGDPIVGYVHRHVARALLPGAWGRAGVIPSSPTTGQMFTTAFSYTLPVGYDESKVHLVAFVNEVSASHTGDEILNAEEVDLMGPTGLAEGSRSTPLLLYPTTSAGIFNMQSSFENAAFLVYDINGRVVLSGSVVNGGPTIIDLSGEPEGVYGVRVFSDEQSCAQIFIKE